MDFGLSDLLNPALVMQSCTKGKGDDTTKGKGIGDVASHVALYEDGDGRSVQSKTLGQGCDGTVLQKTGINLFHPQLCLK